MIWTTPFRFENGEQEARAAAQQAALSSSFDKTKTFAVTDLTLNLAMKNPILDEALVMIRAHGFEPRVVRNRHYKVSWLDRYGRTRLLVISFSPSDRRAQMQSRALLRRLLAA